MTDYETMTPDAFGRGLHGIGLNLVCRDVASMAAFLSKVLGLKLHRQSADFAIVEHGGMVLQLHSDRSFGAHPLLGLVPETLPRGGGAQIYLFGVDPDAATGRATPEMVLEQPRNKPHGLREATLLSPEGYAFTLAQAL